MDTVSFKVEVFEGPLDLLLHLIAKNKVSIIDIPIAEITDQYFAYIEEWERQDIEFSSEFLVMAAQLLLIKSKMLLPKHEEETEEEDPKKELEERLAEYQRYKNAAKALDEEQFASKYLFFKDEEKLNFEKLCPEPISIPSAKLYKAFLAVLNRQEERKPLERKQFEGVIGKKPVSIFSKVKSIVSILRGKKRVKFEDFFEKASSKSEKVATFLAVLELLKTNRMRLIEKGDEIYCARNGKEDEGGAAENTIGN